MEAANPQPHITLDPFRGKADENWKDFESLLRSLINVGNIANTNRPQFLQKHLLDQALQFFRTLPQATRDDFDATKTALRTPYCNPHLRELHKLQLHNLKFDPRMIAQKTFWYKCRLRQNKITLIQYSHQFRQPVHRTTKQKMIDFNTYKMSTKQH